MKPFSRYFDIWLDKLAQEPASLPLGHDGIRMWLEANRNGIDALMGSKSEPNMAEYDLESTAYFGCVTEEMLQADFSPPVAKTLICSMAPHWTDPALCEARDFSLAFLYGRSEHLPQNTSLDALFRALPLTIVGRHLDRLTEAGLPVDQALNELMDQAVVNLMLLHRASEEELGLTEEKLSKMTGSDFTKVIWSATPNLLELEEMIRVTLELPPLTIDDAKNDSVEPR